MKKTLFKIIATTFAALAFNSAQAQVFTVEYLNNSDDTIFTTGSPAELKAMIQLNLEPGIDSFNYTWKFSDFEKPNDWEFFGMCDNVMCHPYEISGDVNPFFKAPFTSQDSTNYTYNKPGDLTHIGDKPYLWFNIGPAASIGVGYFKYTLTSKYVHPLTAMPSTPQSVEIIHVIKKAVSVSVENIVINANDIKLFPNPATDVVNVTTAKDFKIKQVNVIDATGRNLSSSKFENNQVDVSSLPAGIYLIEFVNIDGVRLTTRKFAKQ